MSSRAQRVSQCASNVHIRRCGQKLVSAAFVVNAAPTSTYLHLCLHLHLVQQAQSDSYYVLHTRSRPDRVPRCVMERERKGNSNRLQIDIRSFPFCSCRACHGAGRIITGLCHSAEHTTTLLQPPWPRHYATKKQQKMNSSSLRTHDKPLALHQAGH